MKTTTAWADSNDNVLLGAANARPAEYGAVTPVPGRMRVPVHGSVQPADVREGDPISARVRLASARAAADVEARVWRISPLGVEIVKPPALAGLSDGAAIDLALRIGADLVQVRSLEITSTHEERGRKLLAARWSDAEAARGDPSCRRIGARLRCEPQYAPTGIAPCAVRFDDFVHFRITEISKTGMQLVTSLRNKYLVPGSTFVGTCSFPTLEQVKVEFQVVHTRVVREGVKEFLTLGVTWRGDGARSAEIIGQYLLQFGPGATPEQLRAEGFRVRSTSRAFDFGNVQSEADYREVLALRRAAYVHAKKVSPDATDEQMGDEFDLRSRIVTARYRGRLVGSTRVVFARTDSDRLKHDDYVTLPSWLPPRTEIIESSKTCTDPEFRGSDLFYSLLKHMAIVTLQAGRRYLLMSCTDALRPLYGKLGCADVGVTYVHPTMGLRHHVMMGDVVSMVGGGMNPVVWNVAIGPELWAYARRCGMIPTSPWRTAKVRIVRLFRPLAFLITRQARRRGRGKK